MNKKSFTLLYLVISTAANILLTVLVITALVLGSFALLRFVFHVESSSIFSAALMVCLVGGLLLSFFLYNKISAAVIRHFGFEDKFDDSMFKIRTGANAEKKREAKPRKQTNMPSSVLDDSEE